MHKGYQSIICGIILALVLTGLAVVPAIAGDAAYEFVTLGTQGGPVPNSGRGEPANLLLRPGEAWLVDTGDGAATRMVMAGAPFGQLKGVFISHLHFDHIGGLSAVLGLRHQIRVDGPLTIYGPPGTQELVNGLLAAMGPSAEAGFGVPGEVSIPPATNITVTELADGSVVKLDGFTVTAAANSHYSFAEGDPRREHFKSFSFRFDMPDRSIVFTGDTGPSEAVEKLAEGADLLVSEMIDVAATLENMRQQGAAQVGRTVSPDVEKQMTQHLSTHHLSADQVGRMAQRAKVGKLVVTHLVVGRGGPDEAAKAKYTAEIRQNFDGPVQIADDFDRF